MPGANFEPIFEIRFELMLVGVGTQYQLVPVGTRHYHIKFSLVISRLLIAYFKPKRLDFRQNCKQTFKNKYNFEKRMKTKNSNKIMHC